MINLQKDYSLGDPEEIKKRMDAVPIREKQSKKTSILANELNAFGRSTHQAG